MQSAVLKGVITLFILLVSVYNFQSNLRNLVLLPELIDVLVIDVLTTDQPVQNSSCNVPLQKSNLILKTIAMCKLRLPTPLC